MNRKVCTTGLLSILTFGFFMCAATPAHAGGNEFKAIVVSVEQRYTIHPEHIPLMGFISFCAWTFSKGTVKRMHIADFENIRQLNGEELDTFLRAQLGTEWHPFVKTHERDAREDTFIYVRPDGGTFRMMIAHSEPGELSLVEMSLSKKAMLAMAVDPQGRTKSYSLQSKRP